MLVARSDGSEPVVVSSGSGNHFSPDWTPDGESIAWISEPEETNHGPLGHVLQIHNLRTGQQHVFERLGQSLGAPGRIGMNPRFSPDAARVLVRASDGGFFLANLQTGEERLRFRPAGTSATSNGTVTGSTSSFSISRAACSGSICQPAKNRPSRPCRRGWLWVAVSRSVRTGIMRWRS